MAVGAFGTRIDWEEANRITGYDPRYYTWPSRAVVEMRKLIPGVRLISSFDYSAFARDPIGHFSSVNKRDGEWLNKQLSSASPGLKKEGEAAAEMIDLGGWTHGSFEDALMELRKGALVIFSVDPSRIWPESNGSGHYMLAYEIGDEKVYLHDPGLPPHECFALSIDTLKNSYNNIAIVFPAPNQI